MYAPPPRRVVSLCSLPRSPPAFKAPEKGASRGHFVAAFSDIARLCLPVSGFNPNSKGRDYVAKD